MKKLQIDNLPDFVYYSINELLDRHPTLEVYQHPKQQFSNKIYVIHINDLGETPYFAIMPYKESKDTEEVALWGYGKTTKEAVKDLKKSYKNAEEFSKT